MAGAIVRALAVSLAIAAIPPAVAAPPTGTDPAHGGGCRKSSPPGQCCHMDRKAGKVHCH